MVLNIYKKGEIVKTYKAETYDLMFGTLEDIAGALNLENLKEGTNAEVVRLATDLIVHSMDKIKVLFLDIFDGLTEEELRYCKVKEMARVFLDVVKYTISELATGKN